MQMLKKSDKLMKICSNCGSNDVFDSVGYENNKRVKRRYCNKCGTNYSLSESNDS